jgi:hypothetical protein
MSCFFRKGEMHLQKSAAENGPEVTFCPLYAQRRLAQSNLVLTDVELVRLYGRMIYRDSARQYFIGQRDLERYGAVEPRLHKLQSIVLVVASDSETVITTYRNQNGIHQIKRKPKRRSQSN